MYKFHLWICNAYLLVINIQVLRHMLSEILVMLLIPFIVINIINDYLIIFGLGEKIFRPFYRCSKESIIDRSISVMLRGETISV